MIRPCLRAHRPGHGAEARRTVGRAGAGVRHGSRDGRQAQAGERGAGARGRRAGRRAAGGERAGVSGTVAATRSALAATRPALAATRPALAATRPGQGPRYGHCARLGVPMRA